MQVLKAIVTNHFLIVPIFAWMLSQVVKVFTSMAVRKRFDIKEIKRDGGMPSSHSATVTALMALVGYSEGFGSVEFAICFIVGVIVMRDAVGVRRETGKQAVVIKKTAERFDIEESDFGIDELKLEGGHTLVQIFAGCAMGLAISIAYILIFLK